MRQISLKVVLLAASPVWPVASFVLALQRASNIIRPRLLRLPLPPQQLHLPLLTLPPRHQIIPNYLPYPLQHLQMSAVLSRELDKLRLVPATHHLSLLRLLRTLSA
ncbi:hypothetical protein R3P38DRAFT_3155589 [Favolaschia claudopus]|uniref:Secreted protein n=1 Tax=Favolaschia claudopus TaxID=2862362 RepID=A0AAV9YYB8_9AGAR